MNILYLFACYVHFIDFFIKEFSNNGTQIFFLNELFYILRKIIRLLQHFKKSYKKFSISYFYLLIIVNFPISFILSCIVFLIFWNSDRFLISHTRIYFSIVNTKYIRLRFDYCIHCANVSIVNFKLNSIFPVAVRKDACLHCCEL